MAVSSFYCRVRGRPGLVPMEVASRVEQAASLLYKCASTLQRLHKQPRLVVQRLHVSLCCS